MPLIKMCDCCKNKFATKSVTISDKQYDLCQFCLFDIINGDKKL